MLTHFTTLFQNHDLPIDTVCEPMLKQIEVSEYHTASFNMFDFQFFTYISGHSQLSFETGLLLLTAMSKVALASVVYQKLALTIMLQLIQRYENRPELLTTLGDKTKHILTSLVAI